MNLYRTLPLLLAAALSQLLPFGCTANAQAIDIVQAKAAFAEAKSLSDKDAANLWKLPLYGPLLFVSPTTRETVANQPDPQGVLHPQDGVWVGKLPPELLPANTAVYWQGKHWTMVMWPLPEHALPRRRLMAHEMFHRLQDDLHLPQISSQNPHLDTFAGRYWLQLEWRALALALLEKGDAHTDAIRDALAFRAQRQNQFPGSAETERLLELNEGLAEYTGYAVFAPDVASARWRIEADLVSPQVATFVRSFAYTSGPAYGLLLDERSPDWRSKLTAQSDLGTLLALNAASRPSPDAEKRSLLYGGAALRISEEERAAKTTAEQARYRKLLVDGPTLKLTDSGKFNYSYDPNTVVSLPGFGNVNPSMEVFDAWGTLKAEQGVLLALDQKSVTVAAPAATTGSHIAGPGWILDLSPGWRIVSAPDKVHLVLEKQ